MSPWRQPPGAASEVKRDTIPWQLLNGLIPTELQLLSHSHQSFFATFYDTHFGGLALIYQRLLEAN
jgi:hypothetical protein